MARENVNASIVSGLRASIQFFVTVRSAISVIFYNASNDGFMSRDQLIPEIIFDWIKRHQNHPPGEPSLRITSGDHTIFLISSALITRYRDWGCLYPMGKPFYQWTEKFTSTASSR